MNFMEAVQAMKEGKKVSLPSWDKQVYLFKDKLIIKMINLNGEIVLGRFLYTDFEATDWEVVVDDKDWNLADQIIGTDEESNTLKFSDKDAGISDELKKCRDLIILDVELAERNNKFRTTASEFIDILDKRFGDL